MYDTIWYARLNIHQQDVRLVGSPHNIPHPTTLRYNLDLWPLRSSCMSVIWVGVHHPHVSTSICSLSSTSARAAATRSSSRFICHANSLHWLNFPRRVTYKLCLLTYKCLHGLAPDYLNRICVCVAMVHGRPRLRSLDEHQLLIPRTRTVTLGPCAFNTSGPASWNALPAALRDLAVTLGTFRQMLKSFLFWLTDAYRPWYSCRSTRLCDVC